MSNAADRAAPPSPDIAAALDAAMPSSLNRCARELRALRDRRAPLAECLQSAIEKHRSGRGAAEDVNKAQAAISEIDRQIGAASGELSAARAQFAEDYAIAAKHVLRDHVPELATALDALDRWREHMTAIWSHAQRRGLPVPSFVHAIPDTQALRRSVTRLSK